MTNRSHKGLVFLNATHLHYNRKDSKLDVLVCNAITHNKVKLKKNIRIPWDFVVLIVNTISTFEQSNTIKPCNGGHRVSHKKEPLLYEDYFFINNVM